MIVGMVVGAYGVSSDMSLVPHGLLGWPPNKHHSHKYDPIDIILIHTISVERNDNDHNDWWWIMLSLLLLKWWSWCCCFCCCCSCCCCCCCCWWWWWEPHQVHYCPFFLNATVCGDLHTGQTSWLISTRFIFGVCWYNSFRLIVDFGFSGCQFNGQFLPNNYDECSYFRCDYGPEPYYDVYGKIKFVEVKMKCPYGTSTNRYRFDPYNPCGEASYKCSAPPPPSKFD